MNKILTSILVSGSLLFSINALSEQRSLTVDSFVYVENGNFENRAAELCGRITGAVHLHDRVTVTSDHRSRNSAPYTISVGENGRFCVVVRTVSGYAQAKLWRVGEPSLAKITEAEISR